MVLVSNELANASFSTLVWYAAQEEQEAKRAQMEAQRLRAKEESSIQREEMRKEMLGEK